MRAARSTRFISTPSDQYRQGRSHTRRLDVNGLRRAARAELPGSTYTLTYDPQRDQLMGIYFQAVEQQNFNVYFVRTK